jgi:hypothetical protein
MTANDTFSSVAYFFKTVFDTGLADESMRLHPTLDRIPKIADFTGDSIIYSVKVGNAQNIASTASGSSGVAAAQAVGSSSKGYKFTMVRVRKTGTLSFDIEAVKAAIGRNDGSFENLMSEDVDGFVNEFSDRLGFDLFRDSYGVRGRRSSLNSNTITLSVPDDARNFKIGMLVGASTLATGASMLTGSSAVTAVDHDAGTVTLASAAAIASFADNDYLYAAPEVLNNLQGFEICTPLVTPSATAFRGVDRTAMPSLLAGSRIDDTNSLVEENAGKIAVKIRNNGGTADTLVLNPQRYWEMCRRIGAKIIYQGGGGDAKYGFEGVTITSPAGNLNVISDPDCPTNRGRVFNNAAHKIRTLGEFVHIGNEDGNYELRIYNEDSLESRVRSLANYQQTKPRDFGVFSI